MFLQKGIKIILLQNETYKIPAPLTLSTRTPMMKMTMILMMVNDILIAPRLAKSPGEWLRILTGFPLLLLSMMFIGRGPPCALHTIAKAQNIPFISMIPTDTIYYFNINLFSKHLFTSILKHE